jgi:putative inorganic carbon (HCO3(-)) transporter
MARSTLYSSVYKHQTTLHGATCVAANLAQEIRSCGPVLRVHTARWLDSVIFAALLALIPLVAIPYGSIQPWWEAVFECAVFSLGALWVVDGLFSGGPRINGHRLFVPLIALIAFAFVQTIPLGWGTVVSNGDTWRSISADPYETRRFTLKLLALTVAGILLLRYTSSQHRLRILIHVVIGVGVASALFGIVRQIGQANAANFLLPQLPPDRSYGQFIDRNHFAFLIEMVLGLVLGLMLGGGVHRDRRLLYLATALLLWAALVLSNSRGAIFTMLCQLLFVALVFTAPRSWRAVPIRSSSIAFSRLQRISSLFIVRATLIVCLLMAVIIGSVWVGGDPLRHRLGTVPREFSSSYDDKRMNTRRVEIWQATWRLIRANPIAGTGFAGFWTAFPGYHDGSGVFTPEEAQLRPQAAHNEYLELLASGGLIGCALGAWFVIVFISGAREHLRRSRDSFRRSACLGALVGLFGVAIHSLVDFGLHDTVNAFVFTALVVIATVSARVGRGSSQHEMNRVAFPR